MNKRYLKILEICVHILVVLVFISIGYKNYELFDSFVNGFKSVGFTVATNVYTGFLTTLLFSFYVIYWFALYYVLLKSETLSLHHKIISVLISAIVMTAIHTGVSFIVVQIIQSNELETGQQIVFQFVWNPTNALYTWYLMLGLITFAFWGAFEFLYNYEEMLNANRVQSELSLVRSQIRPHFFFNTLNSMYALALTSRNELLAKGLNDLTGMMRYSMESAAKSSVRLDKEWDYLQRYAELQKLRLDPDQVAVELIAKGPLSESNIAPMILINFLENAFKHGISSEKESFIRAELEVSSEEIYFHVINSEHPSDQDKGSGIGTPQTRKLLELTYGNKYKLQETIRDSIYSVKLSLPSKL